MTFIV